MNALLDETRSARIDFDMLLIRELKVSPTVKELLLEEKPSNMGWGDFAIFSMLAFVLIARIVRFDLRGVIRLCVRLVGEPPTNVGGSDERRKPPAKAPAR